MTGAAPDTAETPETPQTSRTPEPGPTTEDPPPATGDLVVDGATEELHASDGADLDAFADAGDAVHATLQARLRDLDR